MFDLPVTDWFKVTTLVLALVPRPTPDGMLTQMSVIAWVVVYAWPTGRLLIWVLLLPETVTIPPAPSVTVNVSL